MSLPHIYTGTREYSGSTTLEMTEIVFMLFLVMSVPFLLGLIVVALSNRAEADGEGDAGGTNEFGGRIEMGVRDTARTGVGNGIDVDMGVGAVRNPIAREQRAMSRISSEGSARSSSDLSTITDTWIEDEDQHTDDPRTQSG